MKSLVLIATLMTLSQVFAAPFQNLDFEQANTNTSALEPGPFPPLVTGTGPTADLLPGWQVLHRGVELTRIGYNDFPLAGGVTILSSDYQNAFLPGRVVPGLIDGNYAPIFTPDDQPFYLIQQGDIPSGTTRMTFNNLVTSLSIDINGVHYPISNVASSIDVSQFAGQNVKLEFSFSPNGGPYAFGVDSIAFIPEPNAWALFGAGGVAFAFRFFCRGGGRVGPP